MAEAPKELTLEEVRRRQAPKELTAGEVGRQVLAESAESVGRRTLDAFSLGFGDEIIAGVQAAFGDTPYSEALERSEAETQEFQRQASEMSALPFGADPIDLAGLATGGGALFSVARAVPGVRALPGLARSMAGGGVVGGTAAAGQPGTLEERAERMPVGATVGAVAAPLAQGAARAVGAGAGAVRDLATRFLPGAQERRGVEAIARSMERGQVTPEMMEQRLERGGPQMVLADVGGPNVRRLAQQSVELEGEGRALAEDVLTRRNLEQGPRVGRALREAMEENRDFQTVADDLLAQRRARAAPLYERIHSRQIEPTERMRSMIGRSSFRRAYNRARELATEDGFELPTYAQLQRGDADLTGMRIWDYIKRGLDDQVFVSRTPQSGMGPSMRNAVNQTRRDLLAELDSLVPEYAEARAAWAGPARSQELMDMGRNIYDRRDPEEFVREFAELTPEERDFFRLGVVQETVGRIGNVSETRDAAGAFWTKPNNQRKLAAVFPRQENLTRFMDRMLGEQEAALTRREVMGRSPTAERQALSDQYAIEGAPRLIQAARQLMRGDVGGLAETQAAQMAQRARVPPAQREAQARILFDPDRAAQLEYLDMIRRAGRGPVSRAAAGVTSAGAAGLGAGSAGRSESARRLARMFLGGS